MSKALFDLTGSVAIVTGASSGLGVQLSHALAAAGADVVMAARRVDKLSEAASGNSHLHPRECDVNDEHSCAALIEDVWSQFGHIDIVVNNAGISNPMPAVDEGRDAFRAHLETNLVGAFDISRLAAGRIIQAGRQASIINIASVVGMVGLGRMPQAAYAASKGGLVNLTRELAAQWARKGIRVNAICPGFFESEMTADLFKDERGHEWVARLTPMAREGKPGELDGALLFLASDASSYVTGAILPVDGGWTAV